MTVAAYRAAMLERKARAAGCTVDEAELARQRRTGELMRSRREAWATIARHAAAHGRWFVSTPR